MGRYRHRPLHLFGGLGVLMGAVGFVILLYLTVIWLWGAGIGNRPLLTLGVLLVVVSIQLVSLGLLSEMITSQHEERMGERERIDQVVEEVLR
jgi:dolichol-phosphate mannosyltransferase